MNTKGSEWRKWDLHIHTPASFHWIGSKKLREMTSEEKTTEIKNFIEVVNNSDVDVFCLMDYWTFDWYIALKEYLKEHAGVLKKTIFPGMELRIECPVDYRLNIHVILSDKLSIQELIDFKSELYIRSIDKKLSDDALIRFAKSLDESKAKKHGYENPENLDNDKLLMLGSITAEVTKESLNKAFSQIPEDTGFVILPYDTSDGLLKLKWEDHPHDDNYFMQSAHIFETRDKVNIDLISGIKTPENEKFFENFFKTLGNKPKPCIAGSDAHEYKNYGKYPSNKITWIKADCTFDGLKQIIFEPTDRVRIQETNPLLDYQRPFFSEIKISKSFKIFENQNLAFETCAIPLNPSMVSIIGGRGEGKSILMDYFAKGFGYSQNQYLNSENFLVNYSKSFDGEELSYSMDSQHNLAFLYIKQNEVKDLALDAHKLGVEIKRMLNLDVFEDFATDLQDEIDIELEKLSDLKNWFEQTNDNGTKINNAEIVKSVIKRNQDLLGSITNESNKEKLEKYTNNVKVIKQNELRIKKLVDLDKELDEFRNRINLSIEESKEQIPLIDFTGQKSKIEEIKAGVTKSTQTCESDNTKIKEEFAEIYKGDLSSLLENADKYKRNIEGLKSHLATIEKKQVDYNNQIVTRNNLCDKVLAELTKQVELIDTSWSNLLAGRAEWTKEQKDIIKKILTDKSIAIKGKIFFDSKTFYNKLRDCINGRYWRNKNKEGELENHFKINDHISFANFLKNRYSEIEDNPDNYIFPDIEKLFYNTKERLQYLYVQPEITFRGKKLNQISVGQRGTVYLCLKLATETFSTPILFDQPEDDLDNHFITAELIEIFRGLKKFRQVIIITHNANLVVNTDAEQVIVANNRNEELSYKSGALENPEIVKDVCQILEGGKVAFENRRNKYQMTN